jgi:UDP-N-acetylglucosamine--N-acetylmuramyl-(pentapeptide) pyrophosphoryl-undecaprenol N-acetylglucosamine transferase
MGGNIWPSLSRRVALAGGYTAGHVVPMIAVGEAYAEYSPSARIIALGQNGGLEATLMPERGFAFHGIDAAPGFGTTTPGGLAAAARAFCRGFRQARRILANAETEIAVGWAQRERISLRGACGPRRRRHHRVRRLESVARSRSRSAAKEIARKIIDERETPSPERSASRDCSSARSAPC